MVSPIVMVTQIPHTTAWGPLWPTAPHTRPAKTAKGAGLGDCNSDNGRQKQQEQRLLIGARCMFKHAAETHRQGPQPEARGTPEIKKVWLALSINKHTLMGTNTRSWSERRTTTTIRAELIAATTPK